MRRRRSSHQERGAARARRWLDDLRGDVRFALRQMRRAPGAAALTVVTLAVGIGANVTMAGAIDRLLLRPPAHVREPGRVARLVFVRPDPEAGRTAGTGANYPLYLAFRREVRAFDRVGGLTQRLLPFGAGADAAQVRAALVTPSFFSVLGARAAVGRMFGEDDGFPDGPTSGGPPLAVLGHGFWHRQFAGDTAVVGRALRIGQLTYTVVGVAPPDFRAVLAEPPDVWLPVTVAIETESSGRTSLADGEGAWLALVARLGAGVPRGAAEARATAVYRRFTTAVGEHDTLATVAASPVIPGRGPDRPREVDVALWLGGVSALVLLIACANVANLLLARAFVRRREIAVRLALGAARGRLARQLLAEALLMAAMGAAAALYLAHVGGHLVRALLVVDGAGGGFVDARLLAFTAAVALGTGVAISLAPLAQSATPDLTDALRTGAAAGGGRTSRVRGLLLGAQAALCMVLLVGAGLFALSLRRVNALDLGVDLDHTLMASFDMSRVTAPRAEIDAAYQAMAERVRAVPGVARVALAEREPFRAGQAVDARTATRSWEGWAGGMEVPMQSVVDSGYFRTIGATSLRGRDFDSGDHAGAPRVTIINEPLAKLLFPGEDPLGKCVTLSTNSHRPDAGCVTVVGVLRGYFRRSILSRDALAVYVPLAQRTTRIGLGRPDVMLIRATGDGEATIAAVRRALQGVRPDFPPVTVRRVRDLVTPEVRPWRLGATMFSLFGGVALTIAVVGLYGVVAFAAAQRSTEIAVRVALGARPRHVLAVVGADGLRAVGAGLLVGVAGALAARRWIGPLLFQTSPSDPGIIAAGAGVMLAVAVVAILVPTSRALRRNPAGLLRVE